MHSWGDVVGVFVRPASNGAPTYTVEVQSFKREKMQLSGPDWAAKIIGSINADLK